MTRQINKNLTHLSRCLEYQEYKGEELVNGYRGAVLEGSSRSGKTWASVDFIILLCLEEENKVINIVKETYNSFKTTLYHDFKTRLSDFGLPNAFEDAKEVPSFKIGTNQINFLGADKPSKFLGAGCDYAYINEALDVSKDIFDQLEMRCRKFWWMDFNPSAVSHYIFDSIVTRDDVSHLHTTYKDNPFISVQEKLKILSYEPNEKNKEMGTADEFNWKVYGLGQRTAKAGSIFPNYAVCDSLPTDFDSVCFGLDFGYSVDPCSVIEMRKSGNNIYIEECVYETGLLNADLYHKIKERTGKTVVIADSAEPKSIDQLKLMGLRCRGVEKGPDSIRYGINLLKEKRIFITKKSVNLLDEIANYSYDVKKGVATDKPIDSHNHAIDAMRYAGTYLLKKRKQIV